MTEPNYKKVATNRYYRLCLISAFKQTNNVIWSVRKDMISDLMKTPKKLKQKNLY